MISPENIKKLEKLAFYGQPSWLSPMWSPTVGVSNPKPSVSDVLNAIGVAQARGIGTPEERRDAFGRIIDSGLVSTSPAGNALRMLGGGLLGRAITSSFTHNGFIRGLGTGIGAVSAIRKY